MKRSEQLHIHDNVIYLQPFRKIQSSMQIQHLGVC